MTTNVLPPADAGAVVDQLRALLSDATFDAVVLRTHLDAFTARAARLDDALTPLRAAVAKNAPAEQIVALVRDLLGLESPTDPPPQARRTRKARP